MIKRLRIRFIAVAMLSITLVLVTILGVIGFQNYRTITRRADQTLGILQDNGGRFPHNPLPAANEAKKGLSPEAPFESRYFTVLLTGTGEVLRVNTEQIAAVGSAEAQSYAEELFADGKTKGYTGCYRYLAGEQSEGILYIFLDCGRDLDTFYGFLRSCLLFGIVGLLFVLLLVILFSGMVFRPVADADRRQKQFITDANHELKTPLTVIAADCEILELNGGENEWTQSIRAQIGVLTELTDKLLMLSRMDEGRARAQMTDFSLSEVVEAAAAPYAAVAAARHKSFTCRLERELSYHGDMMMMRQLVTLLLDNAIKYSDAAGNICLTLQRRGGGIRLTLSNTTEGVPQGDLSVLFERFYRLDQSRNSETGGHGIGLSVARAIAELHKGKLTASSPDGVTIVFTAYL